MDLRLITWNVHGLPAPLSSNKSERIQALIGKLRSENPDLILLQEVWRPDDAAAFIHAFPDYEPADPQTTLGTVAAMSPLCPIIGQILLPLSLATRIRRTGLLTLARRSRWRVAASRAGNPSERVKESDRPRVSAPAGGGVPGRRGAAVLASRMLV